MVKWTREKRRGRIWLKLNFTDDLFYLTPSHIDEIGQWCQDNRCGRRTSYEHFEFRTEADVTAFLLRWG